MKRLLVAAIRWYQRYLSPLLGAHCIYTPTCSAYALEAINRYGRTEYGPSAPREGTDEGSAFARSLGYKEPGINTMLQFSLPMMAEYQTNLTNLKDNWMVQFITGQKDIDGDWDAYLKEMDASGLGLMFNEAKDYFDSTQ